MPTSPSLLCLALWTLMALPHAARAQFVAPEEAVVAEELREGMARFEAGRAAMARGHFEVALEDFQRAYELTRHPTLLLSIAAAADRLRKDDVALFALELYLRQVPEAESREEIQGRIDVLRMTLAQQRAARASLSEPRATPAEPRVPPSSLAPQLEHVAPKTERTSSAIFPWMVVGASGLALTTSAVLLGVGLQEDESDEDKVYGQAGTLTWDGSPSAPESADARLSPPAKAGFVLLAAGSAGLTLGLLWRYLWLYDEQSTQVSVGLDRVAIQGRF